MRPDSIDVRPSTPARPQVAVLAVALLATLILTGCGSKESTSTSVSGQAPVVASEGAAPQASTEVAQVDAHAVHAEHADGAHADAEHAVAEHATAEHAAAAHAHDASTTIPAQPFAELSGDSLFHLTSAWTDQHQEAVTLGEMAGGPTVVVMFYGDCTTACPLLVKSAEEIEAALPEPLRSATRFVMVSFDTERDTPSKLRDYAASKGLDRDGWHWLVGTPLQTRQLATMLGVQYRDAGNGMFAHSNVVSVLDKSGVPVARLEGLGVDLGPAVEAISAAAGS
ncbi:MAG TPA: SCO family protein [Trueperaceae bacterium]|nr:SCO family protein [Trueperaceae bacterium]